jgi:hypothetical protein
MEFRNGAQASSLPLLEAPEDRLRTECYVVEASLLMEGMPLGGPKEGCLRGNGSGLLVG